MGTDHHVLRQGDRWIVRPEGSLIPLRIFRTRLAAIEAARRLARYEGGGLVVHREHEL